ncbi:MAG: hypothetical protein K6G88_10430 [Lachnospiraceae bacterium]|nr:hypothetical protein [Lachnospiraceae bacterium]
MQYDFQYVPRSEYLPVKKELEKLINEVQNEVREYFTFSFTYVGSTHRRLITVDRKGNIGYDFDVNIHVNDDEEDYSAEEIRTIIRKAFDKYVKKYGYDYCEDSTRVLTIKKKDYWGSRIISSCDFALVYDCRDGRQQYIHFDKKQRIYDWKYLPMSNSELERRAEWIRVNGFWNDVRNNYLAKKNCNDNPKKRSRSIYAETINETYKRHNKK